MENLGVTITLKLDDEYFDQEMSKWKKDFNSLKTEVRNFNKYLKFDPSNMDVLNAKLKNLNQQQTLANRLLDEYTKERNKLMAEGKDSGEHWNDTLNRIKEATNDVIRIEKWIAETNAQLEKTQDYWGNIADNAQKVSDVTADLAQKTKGASNAAKGFLKDAINEAVEYEDAFADVKKTVKASETMYDGISEGLRELAKEVPTSASELAKIAGLAGQMGVEAEGIVSFTKNMVDFGNATNITAEEAAQEIAQIYNVIGKGNDFTDLDRLLSTIVDLGNNTATTEKEIVEMFRNIAAASSRVGMTESQMAALAATLSSLGLDKGGASAVSRIMTNIDMAVDKNSDALKEWARVAGVTKEKFAEIWNTDATTGLMMVVEGIAKAEENGTSLNKTLDDLGVSELRQVDTLSRLVNANKDYADNIKRADIAYEKGSALSEEAAERYKTVKSQIKILVNNFKEFAITIGDIFLPIVRKVIDFFEKMTEWLNNLEPGTKEMIANAIMFVAVLSPLLTVISKMTGSFKVIMDFIPKIKAALALLMPILQSVATMVAGLFSKIAMFATMHPIIAIIIALGAAFIALYNNCEPFREMVQKIITKIKELWDKFKEVNWIEHLGEKFGWLGEIIGGVLEFIKGVVDWITRLIEKVKEFLGLSGEVSSSAASASNIISGRGGSYRSDGFGSGGFNSGGITLNPVFNVSTNNVTRADVRAWSQWMLDDINDGLGRAI